MVAHDDASGVVLVARVKGTGNSADQGALKHLVVDAGAAITGPEVGGCQAIDVGRLNVMFAVKQVFGYRVVEVFIGDLH